MDSWIDMNGPDGDVVLSSRIRLARNLSDFPFPIAMTDGDADNVKAQIRDSILKSNTVLSRDFDFIDLAKVKPLDRMALVERHLISPDLAKEYKRGAVLLSHDEKISIMINEEDHIRIQAIFPGLQLKEALDLADKIDDVMEENLRYAYDEELGYLTSCPTNIGTGLRASVMLHLPALVMTDQIKNVLTNLNKIGLAVRGIYGEGTEALGNIFQISNQITLGQGETEIIENMIGVTKSIISNERYVALEMYKSNRMRIEDMVYRSYGILKNARILSSEECMKHLSNVRLGKNLGILKEDMPINGLLVYTQPANIQKIEGKELSPFERDVARAAYVRERIK